MCGIAGLMKFGRDVRADSAVVRQMCAAMTHRGPDDEGVYGDGPTAIGMRRLSIIDVAGGHQPLSNENGTIWIVFNGEIYNHAELRKGLEQRGHRYRTNSDTETIVHLYEEYGRDCVKHLRGMFAFAIWDREKGTLFVARDRLGIKPLYYRIAADSFLFGSEIKVILAHGSIRPDFRLAALPEYLAFGYLSGEETFYNGILKLMPGHWLDVNQLGEIKLEQYWDLDTSSADPVRDDSYYVQTYRDMLEQAISSHLMSDVPLGVFLSGGLDSSVVAALMTKIRREPVETFSVGYAEQTYSELPYARTVAKHLNSLHHEVLVSEQEFFDALPQLIWHEDEPVVWPSSVSLYFVARLARERVVVVLTGEGSDETLGGYTRYAFTLKNQAWDKVYRNVTPALLRSGVREMVAKSPLISGRVRRKLAHTFLGSDASSGVSYFDNFFSAFTEAEQLQLLTNEALQKFPRRAAYDHVLGYWEKSKGPLLQRLLYTDIKTYLVELLMKQDNMSMAASIESRVPFLDHLLVEFATKIPQEVQLKGLAGKQILKKAAEDLLPHSILYRPKLGFPTPWSGWLAGPRLDSIEKLLLESRSLQRGYFKRQVIERLFAEHRAKYRDNYDRIWRLMNLELWHRVCLEGESERFIGHEKAVLASQAH
jgi:asparagine synthase (glutamine-hydrolysing)